MWRKNHTRNGNRSTTVGTVSPKAEPEPELPEPFPGTETETGAVPLFVVALEEPPELRSGTARTVANRPTPNRNRTRATLSIGASQKGPQFHGLRSYREIQILNESCQMGGLKVTWR